MKSIKFLRATRVCVVLAAVLVASCGGGSGSSNANAPATGDIFVGSTNTPTAGEVVAGGVEGACAPFIDSFGREVSCSALKALPQTSAAAGIASCNNMVDGAGFEGGDGTGVGGGDGTAGDGAGIPNTPITITDVSGQTVRTTTDSEGYYRFSLCGLRPPLVAVVERADQPWKTMMVEEIQPPTQNRNFYTMNLTGLTDVVAAEVAKRAGKASSKDLDANDVALKKAEVPDVIAKINANIRQTLEATGLDADKFNPLKDSFRPNERGHDRVLQMVTVTSTTAGAISSANAGMKVSLYTPNTLTLDQSTKISVVGTDIIETARLSIDGAICGEPTDYTSTGFSQTCKPTQSGDKAIKVQASGTDVFQGAIRVTGSSAPISVAGLAASQSSAGQAIQGGFTVGGATVAMVRVHAGLSATDTYCYQDQSTTVGSKTFSFDAGSKWLNENGKSCSALLPSPGGTATIVLKAEARDSAGNLATVNNAPPTVSVTYNASPIDTAQPITISGLAASQTAPGQAINGSFTISASKAVTMARVHAASTPTGASACYLDLPLTTGSKSFSFSGAWTNENGLSCAALIPAAGSEKSIYFKVEARDSLNNLANGGSPPITAAIRYAGAVAILSVTSVKATQSAGGGSGVYIELVFKAGSVATTMLRVHAGASAAGPYSCYRDVPVPGFWSGYSSVPIAQTMSSWTSENGLLCDSLFPAANSTSTMYFKVEAKDAANNSATLVSAPLTYIGSLAALSVSNLNASQSAPAQPIVGSFNFTGGLIATTMLRVHAGASAAGPYACYLDLSPTNGAKSFSFGTTKTFNSYSFDAGWTSENGLTCSSILPQWYVNGKSNVYFKVEARDSSNNLANAGTPPITPAISYVAGPYMVATNYVASQSGPGQPIVGSFKLVSSRTFTNVRIHAAPANSGYQYCYLDLSVDEGLKSFSFNGNWTSENGKSCASLLPASAGGTSTIYFNVQFLGGGEWWQTPGTGTATYTR